MFSHWQFLVGLVIGYAVGFPIFWLVFSKHYDRRSIEMALNLKDSAADPQEPAGGGPASWR
jgi:hypothetical protein